MRARIEELLRRTLVVVAHPDDECIGAGALMQRMEHATLVFCTDGGPRDPYFWQRFGSRENYAALRRKEAEFAAAAVGIKSLHVLPIVDQDLYLCLDRALNELENIASALRPHAILTMAYEGGHPDHDSCAFLGYMLGARLGIHVWEMPIYHRSAEGNRPQEFLQPGPGVEQLQITPDELARKKAMLSCYVSQSALLETFDLNVECFRPQAKYNFSQQPPTDVINYEVWQWRMTAVDVANAFAEAEKKISAKADRKI